MSRRQSVPWTIWVVVQLGHKKMGWHLWPEHLRTLTHPPNASAWQRRRSWQGGLQGRHLQEPGQGRDTLSWQEYVTSNLSWEILLLETSALTFAHHPFQPSNPQQPSFLGSRAGASHPSPRGAYRAWPCSPAGPRQRGQMHS